MYKIGEFSILSKATIKTLRYYEKENLLLPAHIDNETGYRYYEANQLVELSKIISLRQIGVSIKDIKKIQNGYDIKELLKKRKNELKDNLSLEHIQLSKINYLLEEKNMKIRYVEAVLEKGKENDDIKFMELKPIKAICIYHKGVYNNLRDSYNAIMKYIEDNNFEIAEFPRECYIDGCWNKENEDDYLTEIQVPIKEK